MTDTASAPKDCTDLRYLEKLESAVSITLLQMASRRALDALDRIRTFGNLTAEDQALSNGITMAACFAAEAYDTALMQEDGILGLGRTFLIALADPNHADLDYLRDKPAADPIDQGAGQ